MREIIPLFKEELVELFDFMSSDARSNLCLDYSGLHGYLTCLALSPAKKEPNLWIEIIFYETKVDKMKWPSERYKKHIIQLIKRFYYSIKKIFATNPDLLKPLLILYNEGGQDKEYPYSWCYGFVRAVHNSKEDWKPILKDDKVLDYLVPIFFMGDIENIMLPKNDGKEFNHEVYMEDLPTIPARLYSYLSKWR